MTEEDTVSDAEIAAGWQNAFGAVTSLLGERKCECVFPMTDAAIDLLCCDDPVLTGLALTEVVAWMACALAEAWEQDPEDLWREYVMAHVADMNVA